MCMPRLTSTWGFVFEVFYRNSLGLRFIGKVRSIVLHTASAQGVVLCNVAFFRRGCRAGHLAPL